MSKDRTQKRHDCNREHRSQQTGIMHSEDGIVSIEERMEWNRLRRCSDNRARESDDLIGGVGADAEQQYLTNYGRQTKGIGTYQDQLTLAKRAGHKKVISDPAQANCSRDSDAYGRPPPPGHYRNACPDQQMEQYNRQQESTYGYQPRPVAGSFTKNLGSSLAAQLGGPPPTYPVSRTTDGGRTLITHNYKPAPGYTGGRHLG